LILSFSYALRFLGWETNASSPCSTACRKSRLSEVEQRATKLPNTFVLSLRLLALLPIDSKVIILPFGNNDL
ncbi:hypothetical protein SK128_003077, partial [Halocaridina rubra]